jgi:hypothetical protein
MYINIVWEEYLEEVKRQWTSGFQVDGEFLTSWETISFQKKGSAPPSYVISKEYVCIFLVFAYHSIMNTRLYSPGLQAVAWRNPFHSILFNLTRIHGLKNLTSPY